MPTLKADKGLLAFIYKLYTDVLVQGQFKANPETTMNGFELSTAEKIAIYHSGISPMLVVANQAVNAKWWETYALFIAGKGPAPAYDFSWDRGATGDVASMAGIGALLAEQLRGNPPFEESW